MSVNLTIDDVAGRYRLSVDRFRKKLGTLYALDFPRPLPGFGKLIWSPRHLDVWEAMMQPAILRDKLLKDLGEGGPEMAHGAEGERASWADELRDRLGKAA